ncbi:MAG TPA: quinone-dependent dihydroorotate dehydrogenase [Gaiellaceae bacterium]|nr:quinone-dependent dihydroorotate dehydrogenase [Gaiellaceae bacterium]
MLHRLLFRLDAERAHELASRALRLVGRQPFRMRVDPVLALEALGVSHRTPLGVAAGFDKDAATFAGLGRLGFGHVEVGTVTLEPQPGNDRPRIFRHVEERALVNRMGFPSAGAHAVARRLARRRAGLVVGANLSKRKAASLDEAPADCAATAHVLAPLADYLVVNVSSPNTPGLRELQQLDRLRDVLVAVQRKAAATPLLVKISPDLADDEIDAIADLARELRLAGIVAVNTTVAHEHEQGGLSGPALRARSLEVLARLHARVGSELVLVSVGGVSGARDVWDRIRAGATLVQAYTGFVYGGPLWPARTNRALAALVREHGFERVEDAVGTAAKTVARTANRGER